MTDYAVTKTVARVELNPNAVLSAAWQLYKRLFARSVLMGAIVFGVVNFVAELAPSLALISIPLAVVGVALLQGGLVEIVRGLHVDGDDEISVAEAFQRASGKVWKLIRVSGRTGLGVGLGLLFFVVPGLVLMTRWAVGVPVAMLEDGSPRDAMRRSRAIVDGNGWNVFKVLFACGVLSVLGRLPFLLLGAGVGPFGRWIAVTLGSALTAPFAAHALTVVYYSLREPGRPIALEPDNRWESVWTEQDEVESEPKAETLEEEYARKYDERLKQWGD